MLAIGHRFRREVPHKAKALMPTNRVETKHDGDGEALFGQVIHRSRTAPPIVLVRPILHESLVSGGVTSLVLESLETECLLALHFFKT